MTSELPETVSDRVGRRIRDLRRRRDLTAEQLAARCAEIGAPEITSAVVANIETGRRDAAGRRRRFVTIEEVMIFAYALDVAPVHLVVPTDVHPQQRLMVTPAAEATGHFYREWIRGSLHLQGQDPRAFYSEVPADEYDSSRRAHVESLSQPDGDDDAGR